MKKIGLLAAVALAASVAFAVPVERWVQTSQGDFEQGQAKGVSILTLGQIALAPELKPLVPGPLAHVWALAADAKGNVYAATGAEAKVLRISGGKVETFFASPVKTDLEILSVAAAPDGAVYAAAAPSGTVYRIGPDGKAEEIYKGDDPYIWAMAVARDGALYAVTGPEGKLLKIAAKGKATTLLKAGSRHLLSVAVSPDGSVYAGSDGDGLLYCVGPKGDTRVVFDAQEGDIRALAFDPQGRLHFATANTGKAAPSSGMPMGMPSPTLGGARTMTLPGEDQPGTGGPMAMPRPMPMPPSPAMPTRKLMATNSIYRLAPNGDVTRVVGVTGDAFFSLAWHEGLLYAGTGNDGHLYRIEGTRIVRLTNLDDSQITAFVVAQGKLHIATANPGRVYQVAAAHAAEGSFLSQVHDTAALSRFGTIAWDAQVPKGTSLTLATRTGNVTSPDETWTPWSPELSRSQGEHVSCPPARFIQYRVAMKTSRPDATPTLDEVVVAYAQSNRRPNITQLQLTRVQAQKPRRATQKAPSPQSGMPVSMGMQQPSSSSGSIMPAGGDKAPAMSPRGPFADAVQITWQAADPNRDELVYAVYFRGEDETTWKKLEDKITGTSHEWDTHAVPDGLFRIRVVASDSPTNPPDQALETEKITETFVIDNTPPTVTDLAARVAKDRSVTVTGKCSDAGSGLNDGEYSVDGGAWTPIVPVDGIFDGQGEELNFRVPALQSGEHTLVVRVKDGADNTGAAKTVFTIE